jgi:hypothetical protein
MDEANQAIVSFLPEKQKNAFLPPKILLPSVICFICQNILLVIKNLNFVFGFGTPEKLKLVGSGQKICSRLSEYKNKLSPSQLVHC